MLKPHSEKEVQAVIYRWAMYEKNHPVAIANYKGLFPWEADLLSVTRARYIHEFEVKRTKQDYRAEFKTKLYKHYRFRERGNEPPGWKLAIPNYFWFVTTENLCIDPPEYAGWMQVKQMMYRNNGKSVLQTSVKKNAPLLHKQKMPEEAYKKLAEHLAARLCSRYQDDHFYVRDIHS